MFNANIIAIGGSKVGEVGEEEFIFSTQYEAIQSYANANTIPLPTEAGQQVDDLFIKDLIDNNLWDEIDALWQFTTEGIVDYALINQKTPGTANATLHGTVVPSYISKDGFHGNAAQSAYIDFHWAPANGVNFLQDDATIHVYTTDDTQHTSPLLGCSNASANGRLFFNNKNTSDRAELYMNSLSGINDVIASEGGPGLYSGFRNNSANHQIYRNGSQIGTDTDASNGRSAFDLAGFAIRTDVGIQSLRNGHLGLVTVGSSLLIPATLNTIWNAHLARKALL